LENLGSKSVVIVTTSKSSRVPDDVPDFDRLSGTLSGKNGQIPDDIPAFL